MELVGSDAVSVQLLDLPESACVCGMALARGERVVVGDVEQEAAFADSKDLEEFRLSGLRTVQSTPPSSATIEWSGCSRRALLCACGRDDCAELVVVPSLDYEQVRASPHRFVVASGHAEEVDDVLVEGDGYDIVVIRRGRAGERVYCLVSAGRSARRYSTS